MILSRLDRVILVGTWEILQEKAHKTKKYHRTLAIAPPGTMFIIGVSTSKKFLCRWTHNTHRAAAQFSVV